MTIKIRVVTALAIILTVLLALGANTLLGLQSIDREASSVELSARQVNALDDLDDQIRASFGKATRYTLTERAIDLDLLKVALDELRTASASLDEKLLDGAQAKRFRTETADFLSSVETIVAEVQQRQNIGTQIDAILTETRVTASAIAARTGASQDLSQAALTLLDGLGASGISAYRYRFSRDPADIQAAKRWLGIARTGLASLMTSQQSDRRVARFVAALATALDRYDAHLGAFEAATIAFAQSTPAWKAAANTLLDEGREGRLASSQAQGSSVARMQRAISGVRLFDLCATLAAIAVSALLARSLVHNVAYPLVAITETMRRLAAGHLDTAIPFCGRSDEIGEMAGAVGIFRDGLLRVRTLNAEKDDERHAKQQHLLAKEELNRSFEQDGGTDTASLSQAASDMMAAAKALLDIAAQTSSRSVVVAAAAKEASENVRLVAGSTEQVCEHLVHACEAIRR